MLTILVALLLMAMSPALPVLPLSTLPAWAQSEPAANLQALIGKYDGEWKYSAFHDRAELEITSADGGLLKGRIYYYGSGPTSRRWWPFQDGKLDGSRLSFTTGAGGFEFDVEPRTNSLSGRSLGLSTNANFTFRKAK